MSTITLRDGIVFDLAKHFPETNKPVSVSCTGGMDSTLLLYLVLQMYGPQNVHVCTGVIHGRRQWEAVNAETIALSLGAVHIHKHDDDYTAMGPEEQIRLLRHVYHTYNTCNHYIGEGLNWFSANHTTSEIEERSRLNNNIFVPFIRDQLQKKHVIDMYYQLGIEHLLAQTHSCTTQATTHCGACYCCYERVKGFDDLGLIDTAGTYGRDWNEIVQRTKDQSLVRKNW